MSFLKAKSLDTSTFTVKKYAPEDKALWNNFVMSSKNGTFLFHRDFMDYHSDRFEDYSLIVYKKNKVVGVFPANVIENKVYSHQGLSYGGIILKTSVKFKETALIFKSILKYLYEVEIVEVVIKQTPRIYHRVPSDELDWLFNIVEAKPYRVDLLCVIDNRNPIKIASNRMEGVKKGINQNLKIEETDDFEGFWNQILTPNLSLKHGASPVHSLAEIKLLANTFPKNIKQFNVYKDAVLVGGATIFETDTVAHAQYISANQDKQQLGTLDFLFEYLLRERFAEKLYFDFGASNENQGKNINEGLLYWKECFGGRSIAQSFYKVKTSNYKNLEPIFV